jgi:histidyl-tRNA synthetase
MMKTYRPTRRRRCRTGCRRRLRPGQDNRGGCFFSAHTQENLGTQILITVFGQSTLVDSLKTAFSLRNKKIKTEVYPGLDKIDKQLKYADRKKIPYVIIIGPEEVSKNVIKLKDMKTGKQSELNLRQLLDMFI